MDLSWATIHATLEVLNMETINDYSNRIYKISKKEIDIDNKSSNKSYLASCCSHTMHRFTRALKRQVKFIDKDNETFAVLCFFLINIQKKLKKQSITLSDFHISILIIYNLENPLKN